MNSLDTLQSLCFLVGHIKTTFKHWSWFQKTSSSPSLLPKLKWVMVNKKISLYPTLMQQPELKELLPVTRTVDVDCMIRGGLNSLMNSTSSQQM